MGKSLLPSTVDEGFILSPAALENPGTNDHVFQRILRCTFNRWTSQHIEKALTVTFRAPF